MTRQVGKLVASIAELFSREVEANKRTNIYNNDVDNLYPNRVELVERNSVTASAASNKLKSFIIGKGFSNPQLNELVVNEAKKVNGYKFLSLLANSLSTHRGAFIHVNYDIEGQVNYLDVLDFKKCRISKEDSLGYAGKIFYKNWEDAKEFSFKRKKSEDWFYPFNNRPEVIMDQRKKDAGDDYTVEDLVKNYRGQVLFLNLDDKEVYPYAWIHPAYNDADNEYRISLYRNSNLRSGFLGKNIIIGNGIDAEDQEDFHKSVKDWLGAENTSSVFVVTPKEQVEDPDKIITAVELKSSYDSKRFSDDEIAIANNIRKAYLSIPKILIDPEDSFFGSSGEAFREAIKYYNSETVFIRDRVAYAMEQLFENDPKISSKDFTIKELGDVV